jgi:hypothetical protein
MIQTFTAETINLSEKSLKKIDGEKLKYIGLCPDFVSPCSICK